MSSASETSRGDAIKPNLPDLYEICRRRGRDSNKARRDNAALVDRHVWTWLRRLRSGEQEREEMTRRLVMFLRARRLDEMIGGGLVTLEKVRVILYRSAKK